MITGGGWKFFSSTSCLMTTQPSIQWVPGALSLGVKWPGREADHTPQSSAEVKNAWSYTSTPQYVFMAWYPVTKSTGTTLPCNLYIYLRKLYTGYRVSIREQWRQCFPQCPP